MGKSKDRPPKEKKKPKEVKKPKPKSISDVQGWAADGYTANVGNAPRHAPRVIQT